MPYRDNYIDDGKYQTSIPDPLPSSYPELWYVTASYSLAVMILFFIWVS